MGDEYEYLNPDLPDFSEILFSKPVDSEEYSESEYRAEDHFERAKELFIEDNLEGAIDECTKSIAQDKSFMPAYALRAIQNTLLKQKEAAYHDISAAIELNPENPYSFLLRADMRMTLEGTRHRFAPGEQQDIDQAHRLLTSNTHQSPELPTLIEKSMRIARVGDATCTISTIYGLGSSVAAIYFTFFPVVDHSSFMQRPLSLASTAGLASIVAIFANSARLWRRNLYSLLRQ